jgi:hypothetical protein
MKEKELATEKLLIKDLAQRKICEGHLYLLGKRKFYIVRPGILLDPEFIKRHALNEYHYELRSVVNSEVKETFRSMFQDLRLLEYEKELRLKCAEILNYFYRVHSSGEHFLSFALACYEEFCQVPYQYQVDIHETDMLLFRKSFYSGAFSIITGMANSFHNFPLLRDFYNITFSIDIGLVGPGYSSFIAEACNVENRTPGKGRGYLVEQFATELEQDIFFQHPKRSYKLMKAMKILTFPELAECILYQHELSFGNGFPRGIRKGQVSSSEAVIIFSDSLVEICTEYNFETNVIEFLMGFKTDKLEELPVQRVYTKLIQTLKYVSELKETGS